MNSSGQRDQTQSGSRPSNPFVTITMDGSNIIISHPQSTVPLAGQHIPFSQASSAQSYNQGNQSPSFASLFPNNNVQAPSRQTQQYTFGSANNVPIQQQSDSQHMFQPSGSSLFGQQPVHQRKTQDSRPAAALTTNGRQSQHTIPFSFGQQPQSTGQQMFQQQPSSGGLFGAPVFSSQGQSQHHMPPSFGSGHQQQSTPLVFGSPASCGPGFTPGFGYVPSSSQQLPRQPIPFSFRSPGGHQQFPAPSHVFTPIASPNSTPLGFGSIRAQGTRSSGLPSHGNGSLFQSHQFPPTAPFQQATYSPTVSNGTPPLRGVYRDRRRSCQKRNVQDPEDPEDLQSVYVSATQQSGIPHQSHSVSFGGDGRQRDHDIDRSNGSNGYPTTSRWS